ncbi:MAG: response regulator [bacterium]
MKIMIVDDEKDVKVLFLQQFRKEIRKGKLVLHFAFSGESALQCLEKKGEKYFSLILSDINMPGMNGLELLKAIKARFSGLSVCMITAYGDEQTYRKAVEYGCSDYFTKPIAFKALKKKVLTGELAARKVTNTEPGP